MGIKPAGRSRGPQWKPGSVCDCFVAGTNWFEQICYFFKMIFNNFFQLPGGRRTTKSLSKILLKKNNGCQREALNFLFIVADPFSKNLLLVRCWCSLQFPQSSTLQLQPCRSAVMLACWSNIVSAPSASVAKPAVLTAAAPLQQPTLTKPLHTCCSAKRLQSI